MDMDVYAKLHGLGGATPPKPSSTNQKKEVKEENEFDQNLNAYIKSVIEEEKQNYHSDVVSFNQVADKMSQEIGETAREYNRSCSNGFKIISETLASEGLTLPQVDMKNVDDTELAEAVEHGKPIYNLLGFSFEDLGKFQQIANTLFDKGEFDKACDCYDFLTMVASNVDVYWLGVGICKIKLGLFNQAQEALLVALELNPFSKDAYVNCIHAYIKASKFDEAEKLCDRGVSLAKQYDNPEAKEIGQLMIEAKEFVKSEEKM